MVSVSNKYKQAMEKPIRDRAYISVGIGVVNQSAQGDSTLEADGAYWSNADIFDGTEEYTEYATMEQNFFKSDGSMIFLPEENPSMQIVESGFVSKDILGSAKIVFSKVYAIKGITIDFGSAYPKKFKINTKERELTFDNDSSRFVTVEALGDTDYIEIIPNEMVGGEQRLRIYDVVIGVGLVYKNQQTKDFSLSEYVSSISKELPSTTLKYSFFDENNYFNVDSDNSFIGYLETMQPVTISFGITLDDGTVEWNQFASLYLKDWSVKDKIVSITATDRLSQMEDEYSLANRMYSRTAYEEAVSIFEDAGLSSDEYSIDEYLKSIQLQNPMPENTHKACLQILANACRCIIRQDENGITKIIPNFAVILDTNDMEVSTNGVAAWSKPQNVTNGAFIEYANMTQDTFSANGNLYFLPENEDYLETGYVSEQMSNENGLFDENPTLTISMPAAYTFFNVFVDFGGNPPDEMIVKTYKSENLNGSVVFNGLTEKANLIHEFSDFDKMVFEFSKAHPNNRIVVNKVSFSDLSDFVLNKDNMKENPIGYKENRVKSVRCKIYTYETDENGNPTEVEDNVFFTKELGEIGEVKTIENPLISTQEQAIEVSEWIGNYFANNVSYETYYRGDPRNNAADIIHMDNDTVKNLQVEIERHTVQFNGAFSGSMELRRALKIIK